MKKVFAVVVAITMLAAVLVPALFVNAGTPLTLGIGEVTGIAAGATIDVPITITNNPGFNVVGLTLTFTNNLTFISPLDDDEEEVYDTQTLTDGKKTFGIVVGGATTTSQSLFFDGPSNGNNVGGDGNLAVFKFKVADTINVGDKFTISVSVKGDGEPVNKEEENVPYAIGNSFSYTVPCSSHVYDAGVVTTPAGCETKGVKTYTCTNCGTTKTEDIDPIGHAWDAGVVTTPATCEAKGVKTYTCTNDASHKKTEDIDPIGHAWDAGVVTTPATCETKGVRTYTCTNDPTHTKTEDIDPTGHTWDAGVVTTPATCETKGVKTYTCTNDASHKKTEDIPALGHNVKDWTITKEATLEAEGERVGTCTVCNQEVKEAIAKLTPAPEEKKTEDKATGDTTVLFVLVAVMALVGAAFVAKKRFA